MNSPKTRLNPPKRVIEAVNTSSKDSKALVRENKHPRTDIKINLKTMRIDLFILKGFRKLTELQ